MVHLNCRAALGVSKPGPGGFCRAGHGAPGTLGVACTDARCPRGIAASLRRCPHVLVSPGRRQRTRETSTAGAAACAVPSAPPSRAPPPGTPSMCREFGREPGTDPSVAFPREDGLTPMFPWAPGVFPRGRTRSMAQVPLPAPSRRDRGVLPLPGGCSTERR